MCDGGPALTTIEYHSCIVSIVPRLTQTLAEPKLFSRAKDCCLSLVFSTNSQVIANCLQESVSRIVTGVFERTKLHCHTHVLCTLVNNTCSEKQMPDLQYDDIIALDVGDFCRYRGLQNLRTHN